MYIHVIGAGAFVIRRERFPYLLAASNFTNLFISPCKIFAHIQITRSAFTLSLVNLGCYTAPPSHPFQLPSHKQRPRCVRPSPVYSGPPKQVGKSASSLLDAAR